MGTEVLRPQDCLIQRIRVASTVFNRRKSYNVNGNGNGNGNPRSNNGYRKPKRSPEPLISKRSSSSEDLRPKSHNNGQNNLASGSVTILKRGELLNSRTLKNGDEMMAPVLAPIRLSPASTGCRSDTYAGSAFSNSPSPRALPLPSFFSKKQGSEFVDDSATRDLRRLLRLD